MSDFASRWMRWDLNLEVPTRSTDKTDKSTVVDIATHKRATDRADKSPSVSFVSSLLESVEKTFSSFTWNDFYPDINPAEWEIKTGPDGSVFGEKVRGQKQGTVTFLIPAEVLKQGPTPKVISNREEWDAKVIQLPVGENGELVNWQLRVRLDRPGDIQLHRITKVRREPEQKKLW
jgi:hypothetical protein